MGRNHRYRTELLCLLFVNAALFAHALFNFVFYNLYLNMVSWILFARIVWLARVCHLFVVPVRFPSLKKAGIAFSIFLLLFTTKYGFEESGNAIYGQYENKSDYFQSLANDDGVLGWFLRIDPDNVQAAEVYARTLLDRMPVLTEEQQKRAFVIAWEQVSLMQERYPHLPQFHLLAGDLLAEGVRLKIADVPDMAMGHWLNAAKVNPGFVLAHLRIAQALEDKAGAAKALDYMLGEQQQWLKVVSWSKTKAYWQEAKRLAEQVDPEKAEQINQLIQKSGSKVRNLSSLRQQLQG